MSKLNITDNWGMCDLQLLLLMNDLSSPIISYVALLQIQFLWLCKRYPFSSQFLTIYCKPFFLSRKVQNALLDHFLSENHKNMKICVTSQHGSCWATRVPVLVLWIHQRNNLRSATATRVVLGNTGARVAPLLSPLLLSLPAQQHGSCSSTRAPVLHY